MKSNYRQYARQAAELPELVITPHTGLETFTYAIKPIVRDFSQSTALMAWRMFVRDTRATYRQSLLDYFWLFVPPLATVLICVALNKSSLVDLRTGEVQYPVFVVTGTVLRTAFNTSVMAIDDQFEKLKSLISDAPHLLLTFEDDVLASPMPEQTAGLNIQ